MRRLFLPVLVLIVTLFSQPAWASEPYVTFRVDHGDGSFALANGYLDHLSDESWLQESDYLDKPQTALDLNGTKYSSLGMNNSGMWTFYVWAGNRMVDGSTYGLLIQTNGPTRVIGEKSDGTVLFSEIICSGQSFSWTLEALHAPISSWRTKGYRFEATSVPEPYQILMAPLAFGLLIAMASRRKK